MGFEWYRFGNERKLLFGPFADPNLISGFEWKLQILLACNPIEAPTSSSSHHRGFIGYVAGRLFVFAGVRPPKR